MTMSSEFQIRELDHRRVDGISVTLYWNSQANRVYLTVEDDRLGTRCELEVPAADALNAFRHPYAYIGPESSRHACAA
jgi:hypothetical protein